MGHLINEDDLSIFSLNDEETLLASMDPEDQGQRSIKSDPVQFPDAHNNATTTDEFDDDWSISSDAIFLQTTIFQPHNDQELPSIEAMIFKLSRTMLRSARTRAIVSKNVYPDLRRRGYGLPEKKNKRDSLSWSKTMTVFKANRSHCTKPSDFLRASQRR